MALWGAEVKPGQDFVHRFSSSNGRLRITRATLGSQKNVGWSNLQARVGHETRALLCTLHPISKPMCGLELELEEDKGVTFSVDGQNSVHLSGYYTFTKHHACTVPRPTTLSKGTHKEMPDRSGNNKKARREDGKTSPDADDEISDEEWNDGTQKTNVTPPPPFSSKKKVTYVLKKPSRTATSDIRHQRSDSGIQEISDTDEEKEIASKAKADAGLKSEIITKGHPGAKAATIGSKVRVEFVGRLRNGEVFDQGKSYQFKLGAGKVIRGWEVGIAGMVVGEQRRLTIPPSQGYGDMEQDKIPANSWVIYKIKLLEVE